MQALNNISIDKIIEMVTQEVAKQLNAAGVTASGGCCKGKCSGRCSRKQIESKTESIDMSQYQTPILTEKHINRLHELTGKIVIPPGTVITPKAREIVKRKQIVIEIE